MIKLLKQKIQKLDIEIRELKGNLKPTNFKGITLKNLTMICILCDEIKDIVLEENYE